jgi:AcrR family transcriptional regulator
MKKKKRVRKEPEVRRAEIMDAASRLFLSRGYQSTTVDDIVGEAGVGKGTFYLYFESKPQVLVAIIERIQEEIWEEIEKAANSPGDARARLYMCLTRLTEGYRKNEELVELLHMAGPETAHERLRSRSWEKMRVLFRSLLEDSIEEGYRYLVNVDETVDFILAVLDGVSHHIHSPQSSLTMESAARLGDLMMQAFILDPGTEGKQR